MPRIVQNLGKLFRQPNPLVELPNRQQPCIAGQLPRRRLHNNWLASEKIK
jgi:hypothetical protein